MAGGFLLSKDWISFFLKNYDSNFSLLTVLLLDSR